MTLNDKLCAALVDDGTGNICIQVVDKAAATPVLPKIDTEIVLLCDTGNNDEKFYSVVQYKDDGTFDIIAPIDLTGAPYNPVGPSEICGLDAITTILADACDELADGSLVRFYYLHTIQAGAIIASTPIGADGNPYVITNEVPENKGQDIEVTSNLLCDVGNSNKPYIMVTNHNTASGVSVPSYFELDGTTTYVPVTGGVYKPVDTEIVKVWYHTKGDTPSGATEHYWDQNGNGVPAGTGANFTSPIDVSFSEVDGCGILQHENPADSITVIPTAITTDPGGNPFDHQSFIDFWVSVPSGGASFSGRIFGFSAYAFYVGGCDTKLSEVHRGIFDTLTGTTNPNFVSLGSFNEGFYHMRAYVGDNRVNGRVGIQWDLGLGAGLEDIPVDNLFAERPTIYCDFACIDKSTNKITLLDGTVLDDTTHVYSPSNLCAEYEPLIEDKPQSSLITGEKISAGAANVSLNVAAGANGAIIQFQANDPLEAGLCARYQINGTPLTANDGYLAQHKEYLYLGCAASNGATIVDAEVELFNFEFNQGEATNGYSIEVTYYQY